MVEPGLNPRSPLIVELPVLVIVEPARTIKVLADPRDTADWPVGAPVVKLHTKLLLSALPARSLTPLVIVAVYMVLAARLAVGVKIAVTPAYVTVPVTRVVPCIKVKVALVTVDGDNASLKTAVMALLAAIPVAALIGKVAITVGGVVSEGEIAKVAKPISFDPPVDCAV